MITIHVGLHKTGSTSIQTALRLAHGQAGLRVFTPWTVSGDAPDVASVIAASRTGHAVVSDEGLLGDMADAYLDAPKRLAQIRAAVGSEPFEIIMLVRPQESWLASVYLQLVQQGRVITVEDFWAGMSVQPHVSWSTLAGLLMQDSGAARVTVRAYVPERDAVDDFFASAGLPKPPRPTTHGIRENVSISAVQAPILQALNCDPGLDPAERLRMRHLFQDRLAAGSPSGYSVFPEDLQVELIERFRDDWAALARLVEPDDPAEAMMMRQISERPQGQVRPFAGAALTDPLVGRELLRTVRVLADRAPDDAPAGMVHRVLAKAKANPRDLPQALVRAVRRGVHR